MKLSDYLKWIAAVSGAPDPKSISQAETLESRVAELEGQEDVHYAQLTNLQAQRDLYRDAVGTLRNWEDMTPIAINCLIEDTLNLRDLKP